MIARKYRFHGRNALTQTYKQGRTARTPHCMVRYAVNPRLHHCRVAVVVSKKVNKSAVVRNRLRRRIYSQMENRIGELPNIDLIFTVLSDEIASVPEKDINNIISKLLQIAGTAPVEK